MQQSLLDAIIRFAQACDAVTALLLIGSQARTEMKADEFSDTDLIMVVQNPDDFIHADSWLKQIGRYHISFTEPTVDGQMERRVLFDDAQDVDFVIIREDAAKSALETGEAARILNRGYRVLVAKRGFVMPSAGFPPAAFLPADELVFRNTVSDFWFHTVWSAKKLLRQELWAAKFCVDGYMKQKLLWMIEQHEHLVRRSGKDTWYSGRFIDQWAREDIVNGLQNAFAHYDRADIAKALLETMNLFRRVGLETAKAAGFDYPAHADEYASKWVLERLQPLLQTKSKGE